MWKFPSFVRLNKISFFNPTMKRIYFKGIMTENDSNRPFPPAQVATALGWLEPVKSLEFHLCFTHVCKGPKYFCLLLCRLYISRKLGQKRSSWNSNHVLWYEFGIWLNCCSVYSIQAPKMLSKKCAYWGALVWWIDYLLRLSRYSVSFCFS